MDQKLSRTILLIVIITISSVLGGIFVMKSIAPSIQMEYIDNSNLDVSETIQAIPQKYIRQGFATIEDECDCLGTSYSDNTPPIIQSYLPNNSIVGPGTPINLSIIDNNPFYFNTVNQALYHWETDQSNTTLVDSALSEEEKKGKLYHEIVLPNAKGTYVLYVYAEDYGGLWSSVIFRYTVIPTGDPPTIEFVAPRTSNESLTGMYLFQVNVTDDFGPFPLDVQMQIVSTIGTSASLTMDYNESSGYYNRFYNLSKLTKGYRWLNVTAEDDSYLVSKEIDFTVFSEKETVDVSNPPEWDLSRSDLPANLSDYFGEDKFLEYNAESGNIHFKVAAKDDVEIATVDLTIYIINNFDPSIGKTDISDTLEEFTQNDIQKSGTDNPWDLYEYSWSSTSSPDGYYLCEFKIQDTDEVANKICVSIVLEIDNIVDQSTGFPTEQGSPGFLLLPVILALLGSVPIIIKKRRKKED